MTKCATCGGYVLIRTKSEINPLIECGVCNGTGNAPETAARCGEAQPGSKSDNGIPGAAVPSREAVDRDLTSIELAFDSGKHWLKNTRAHIAAQAEKIAKLELEVAGLKDINATVYKSGRMDEAA